MKTQNPNAFPNKSYDGMTMLDYFATKAMQSILEVQEEINIKFPGKAWDDKNIARNAYNMAEAMLKESEKRNQ